jgi:hypothetical protein
VSSCSGDQTSSQELALTKALKPNKKLRSGSSGLSHTEKASAINVGSCGGKKSLPRTGVSGAGMTSKALDLFGPASSTSEDKAVMPVLAPHQKRPQKSPLKTF